MSRTLILVFLLALFCKIGISQNNDADNLKAMLATETKPVERFDLLNRLVLELTSWKGDNVDSAYCMQMLEIAQQEKNDSLLSVSYNWLGTYFYLNKGDNSSALEYYFKSIPLAKAMNDKRRISSLYFDIALIYFDLQNNQAAVKNTRLGGQNLPNQSHPLYDFMLIQYQANLATYFLNIKQPDSAFYYIEGLSQTNKRLKGGPGYEFLELTLKGTAYSLVNNYEMAEKNFKNALALSDSVESTSTNLQFYINYIPFLLNNNKINEAGIQAKRLLKLGVLSHNNNLKLAGAGFLRRVFDERHQIDSAYYYSQMEAEINASIFSQNNQNRIQALTFNEQLRNIEEENNRTAYRNQLRQYALITGLVVFLIILTILFRSNKQKQKTNIVLESTLSNLKSTQSQLVQSEKMASLGELTAGIAHEIQNPLNFVNNFSEVNKELIVEMKAEIEKGDLEEVKAIANDIESNEEKINHHGKRADAIVKGMLQHSRSSSGTKEPTDINALADEYLRLAYHGLRAKDKTFNATMETDYDESLEKVNVIPQDIGRVVLNLITNAFYATNEKAKLDFDNYEPTVTISTKKVGDNVEVKVKDNGNGIPQKVLDKIFQPFFTTKPTGQGTGLGLSLAFDIVKAHGGEIKVETIEARPDDPVGRGEGTEFIIQIPAI